MASIIYFVSNFGFEFIQVAKIFVETRGSLDACYNFVICERRRIDAANYLKKLLTGEIQFLDVSDKKLVSQILSINDWLKFTYIIAWLLFK